MTTAPDIFLSYNREDQAHVKRWSLCAMVPM